MARHASMLLFGEVNLLVEEALRRVGLTVDDKNSAAQTGSGAESVVAALFKVHTILQLGIFVTVLLSLTPRRSFISLAQPAHRSSVAASWLDCRRQELWLADRYRSRVCHCCALQGDTILQLGMFVTVLLSTLTPDIHLTSTIRFTSQT